MTSSDPRIEPFRERVVEHQRRDAEHVRVARALDSVALKGAEIARVTRVGAELVENRPVAFLALRANFAREVVLETRGDLVIVEEGIVHVEQKYDPVRYVGNGRHGAFVELDGSAAANAR